MAEPVTQQIILCSTCQGDPRASLTCKACGGSGLGLPSADGLLTWGAVVDDFPPPFKKIKLRINVFFHLTLIVLSLLTLAAFVWRLMRLDNLADVSTLRFWSAGYPEVTFFWFGLFLDCFIIFRSHARGVRVAAHAPGQSRGCLDAPLLVRGISGGHVLLVRPVPRLFHHLPS